MKCPNCNATINPNVKFCPECGKELPQAAQTTTDIWAEADKKNSTKVMEVETSTAVSVLRITSWVIAVTTMLSGLVGWVYFLQALLQIAIVAIDYQMLKKMSVETGERLTGTWMWWMLIPQVYIWKKCKLTHQSKTVFWVSMIAVTLTVIIFAITFITAFIASFTSSLSYYM